MSQIEINCIGSDAVFTNTPNIFSGGNVDTVKFTFDSDWNSYTTKTAVFYNNPKETALQILGSNNTATIPADMIAQKGKLSIGVIGTNADNEVKTSKILTYIVGKGAVTNDMETTAPTPNIWLQLLAIVEQSTNLVENAIEKVDNMQITVDESQMPNKANIDLSNVPLSAFKNKEGVLTYEAGSYVGTGEFGADNPNILTFDKKPRILILNGYNKILEEGLSTFNYGISENIYNNLEWLDNGVKWYYGGGETSVNADHRPTDQYNASGVTYRYTVIF